MDIFFSITSTTSLLFLRLHSFVHLKQFFVRTCRLFLYHSNLQIHVDSFSTILIYDSLHYLTTTRLQPFPDSTVLPTPSHPLPFSYFHPRHISDGSAPDSTSPSLSNAVLLHPLSTLPSPYPTPAGFNSRGQPVLKVLIKQGMWRCRLPHSPKYLGLI